VGEAFETGQRIAQRAGFPGATGWPLIQA